jgi:hypothetical protein
MLQPDSKILVGIEYLAASSELGTTCPGASSGPREAKKYINVRIFIKFLSLWATELAIFKRYRQQR